MESPAPDRAWTSPEAYVIALARKRSFRKSRGVRPRTQPEKPRMLLSTVPFLLLIGLLAILAVGIMVVAFPGNQPLPRKLLAAHERGFAERGWFQDAQKEMHH